MADSQRIDDPNLSVEWSEAPWDSALFGFPVLQITDIVIRGPHHRIPMRQFERLRDSIGCRFSSCRLDANKLSESILLEDRGFRYIETAYQPVFAIGETHPLQGGGSLEIRTGTSETLNELLAVAGVAFRNERFHVDPRLDPALGDQRYKNWVISSLNHPRQKLFELRDGTALVSFFVTEMFEDGTVYWHLNAVAPAYQGRGYGLQSWLAMMAYAEAQGAKRVRSNIVARNVRVLNLYAKLGFRFLPPQMTFHWVAPS